MIEAFSNFFQFSIIKQKILVGQCEVSNDILNSFIVQFDLLNKIEYWAESEKEFIQVNKQMDEKFINKKTITKTFPYWILKNILCKVGIITFLTDFLPDTQIDFKDVFITKTPNGKPIVNINREFIPKNHVIPQIYLSISHSENYLYIAIGLQPIGIDCEMYRDLSNDLQQQNFTLIEKNILKNWCESHLAIPNSLQLLLLWCLKEATLKCNGQIPLGKINSIKLVQNNLNLIMTYKDKKYLCFKIEIKEDHLWIIVIEKLDDKSAPKKE